MLRVGQISQPVIQWNCSLGSVTCNHVACWTDLPAGHPVKLLVGFSNKGSQDFIVDTMDAAFRYPQDYSFYIQNVWHCTRHIYIVSNNFWFLQQILVYEVMLLPLKLYWYMTSDADPWESMRLCCFCWNSIGKWLVMLIPGTENSWFVMVDCCDL